ncbi:MAG: hypothetical protein H6841_08890 [Planctomycetes bacterium]|nr:hypothetical protein [Planctomycetota bacterium]MCB9936129.1 hypothetical protein [Planctomycetota bacterium]
MALLNNLEHEELFGGLRGVPLRMLPALGTTLLLYLSGDMVGAWPLAWVALIPLCFACRGAGPVGALLLAALSLLLAAVTQSFWLLDVEGAAPLPAWLAGGLLPAIPLAAIELPICRKIPWALRPLLVAVLATGFWALLPPQAAMLVPLGGLIEGELLRLAWPKLGPSTVAGCMLGLGWLSAEMFHRPRGPLSRWPGWQGLVLAGLLLAAGGIDWWGSLTVRPSNRRDTVSFYVVTDASDPVGATADALANRTRSAIVVWRQLRVKDDAERAAWLEQAGRLASSRRITLVMVLAGPDATTAYAFAGAPHPAAQRRWLGAPGEVSGEPLVLEDSWQLRVFPSLASDSHWSTQWSTEIFTTPLEPAHPAQERFWVREQRREAVVRASRQIAVWAGGGVAVDGQGNVLARGEGRWFAVLLPAAEEMGEALGHPRLRVLERILALAAPVLALMLLALTPISWAKRRWRLARHNTQAVAIEEVQDDEPNLSKEETEKITRRYKRDDLE